MKHARVQLSKAAVNCLPQSSRHQIIVIGPGIRTTKLFLKNCSFLVVLTHFVNGQFGTLQDPASVLYIESVFSSLCVLLNRVFINTIISAYKLCSVIVSHWALFFEQRSLDNSLTSHLHISFSV